MTKDRTNAAMKFLIQIFSKGGMVQRPDPKFTDVGIPKTSQEFLFWFSCSTLLNRLLDKGEKNSDSFRQHHSIQI